MTDTHKKAAVLPIKLEEGKTQEELLAKCATDGIAGNAFLTMMYSTGAGLSQGDELGALCGQLQASIDRTKLGSIGQAEELLTAQATSLNAIYVECARRAAVNIGHYPDTVEKYLRLALKAQAQCRTTLESLAEIKNPRSVAFVKQANIANGHQQVNNGPPASEPMPTGTREEIRITPVELLEDQSGNVTRLDARAPGKAGRSDPAMETLGAVHGTANGRGKGSGVA